MITNQNNALTILQNNCQRASLITSLCEDDIQSICGKMFFILYDFGPKYKVKIRGCFFDRNILWKISDILKNFLSKYLTFFVFVYKIGYVFYMPCKQKC